MKTTVWGKFEIFIQKTFLIERFRLTKILWNLNTATDFSMYSFELLQFSLNSPVKNIKKVKFKPYNFLSLCSSLSPKKSSFSSDSKPTNTTNHVFRKNFSFILFSLQFFVPCVIQSQLLRFPSSLSILQNCFYIQAQ